MASEIIKNLLIATQNPAKVREISGLLGNVPITFGSLNGYPGLFPIDETGSTFAQNSELKAAGYAAQTAEWCLADDSGLEVVALGGRPGVLSARYGGPDLDYPAKIALLLDELSRIPDAVRTARFVCVMTLADAAGRIRISAEGECLGRLAHEPSGNGGFGFDPIFIPDGFERTFGQLPGSVKASISHRANAAKKIMRYLLSVSGNPT